MAAIDADSSKLEEFKARAAQAEEELAAIKDRLASLETQLADMEGKSGLQLGAPSSMADDLPLNLRFLCERGARVQPNTEVVTKTAAGYHRMTFLQAQQLATRLASALHKLGIKIGDRVATFMWNNARHMLLYYAVPSMGAVLHTLNIRLSSTELAYIIKHAEDKVLFVDATLLPLIHQIDADVLSKLHKIIVCGKDEESGGWDSALENTIDFDEFFQTGDAEFDWPAIDERSGAALCYTSGTTGNPKGVMYSHRSCYLHTLACMGTDVMGISGADCVLPVVPMFHALSWCTPFSAFCLGYKYVLYNCYRQPKDFMNMVRDEGVTLLLGVPTILTGIKLAMDKADVYDEYASHFNKTWTRAACGGSAPSSSLIQWYWERLNIEVIHGWGMTELNPVGSIGRRVLTRADLSKSDEEKHANQVMQGVMIPMVDAKIVNPDNYEHELKCDGESMGELLARGPTVAKRYYNIDAAHKFYNGWLLTGDIASITEEYALQLRDRSKDMIKSGGEWISSVALENEISSMPGVGKAAVVAAKHPQFAERPVVFLEMNAEDQDVQQPTLEDVRAHLMATNKFAKFQLPDDVIFDNIPLTGTGKMSKKLLKEKLDREKYVLPALRDDAPKK